MFFTCSRDSDPAGLPFPTTVFLADKGQNRRGRQTQLFNLDGFVPLRTRQLALPCHGKRKPREEDGRVRGKLRPRQTKIEARWRDPIREERKLGRRGAELTVFCRHQPGGTPTPTHEETKQQQREEGDTK